MKWTLKQIVQETNHPFLNFYTLTYDVEKDDHTHSEYSYYLASRQDKEHLRVKTEDFRRPDGVLIPLYYIDPKTKEISVLLTRQFRPAVGRYCTSFTAGLIDKEDDDILVAAAREAREESGAEVTDLELMVPPAPTSSGLSDEVNTIVLGRITSFGYKNLEEFEDIHTKLYPLKDIPAMLQDPEFFFPVSVRLFLMYLLERFKNQA